MDFRKCGITQFSISTNVDFHKCETGKGKQYLVNFFPPKSNEGDAIPLIYFAIQVTAPTKLKRDGVVHKILTETRNVSGQFGIDPF